MFRDLPPPGSGAVEMVVTECPDPATAAGADRLRERALFWYRRFLAESPRANDPTDDDNIVTRMRVADVLRARDGEDDVSEALLVLKDSIEMAPGSLRAPSILVRMVECYRELGPGWEREAERNARRIVERYADSEQDAGRTHKDATMQIKRPNTIFSKETSPFNPLPLIILMKKFSKRSST